MPPKELNFQLNQFPRAAQFACPSPLERLLRLEDLLPGNQQPQLWIKRDDLLGPAMGGNKGRKLVFLMGEALALGKSKVATYGGLGSNSARMTAAACNVLGMEAHIFYSEEEPTRYKGNLLLNKLMGAKLHFQPDLGGKKSQTVEIRNEMVQRHAEAVLGSDVYFIPNGGHNLTGCLGYVAGACEIHDDVLRLGLNPAKVTVITATGTGGTLAGMLAGFVLLGSPIRVLGIDIAGLFHGFREGTAAMVQQLTEKFDQPAKFSAADVPIIEDTYVGAGYGKPTANGMAAIRQLARCEAILLDPVYTGKTAAGMLDLVKIGRFGPDEHVIFLHTGGTPGLFANHQAINDYLENEENSPPPAWKRRNSC